VASWLLGFLASLVHSSVGSGGFFGSVGSCGSYGSSSLVPFSFSLHMQSKTVIIENKQNYYCNQKNIQPKGKEGRKAG